MSTTTAITFDEAIEILTGEGHGRGDVLTAIDSLIDAGLNVEDAIDADDMETLRDQLAGTVGGIAIRVAADFSNLTTDDLKAMGPTENGEFGEGLEVDGAAVWYRPEDNKIVVFRGDHDGEDGASNWAEVEVGRDLQEGEG